MTAQELKDKAWRLLCERVPQMTDTLRRLDERMVTYYDHLVLHSGTRLGDEDDLHCLSELLGALKLLRLLAQYDVDYDKVHQVLRLREGEWHQEGKMWVYDSGGLELPGTGNTKTHYRWEPFQVFVWVSIYGVRAYVDTEVENGTRKLLDTEREGEDGTIEDLRRLCTDFTLFGPRKIDKTGINAYDNLLFFMLGDANSETYCTANSQTQAKLLFNRTADLIRQMDRMGSMIRFTSTAINWKPGQFRDAQVWALSAGGKTKDGLFAEKCAADEYGSAAYVNNKSDMGALVSVVQSSMGPRREPLTLTTTTAGNISAGPFKDKIEGIKRMLADEIEKEPVENPRLRLIDPEDRWMCLCLEPDEWERDEDFLLKSRTVRRKINPMLGKIVQHSFYDDEIAKSKMDPVKHVETITKLFNVYQTGKVKDWVVTPDKVRKQQIHRRVDDCLYRDGWSVFVGMDFSGGGDPFTISYFCVNYSKGLPIEERFFADTQAWIMEKELETSPNRQLYERWIKDGWMRVAPGETFNPDWAINELMAKNEKGINLMAFGYDPAQSRQPINTLKAWLQSLNISIDNINSMVMPVSQSFMSMNPLIGEMEHYIMAPWLKLSDSPIWAWEAGNVKILTSRDDTLRRLHKSGPANKIDSYHALLDAIYTFDITEGKITK